MSLRGIVLLAFFVGSLPVAFIRPFYGILLWTVVAFLNPQSFTWGAAEAFPWAVAAAVPTVAGLLVFGGGSWDQMRTREVILLAIVWLWFTFTTVISLNTAEMAHHAFDTKYRWTFVSKILLMTMMTIPLVNTLNRLRLLAMTIAGSFGFFVAKGFPFILMTGGAHRIYGPDRSMIADNNDFGLALNMTLPFFFFLAQTEERRIARIIFGSLFAMGIPVVFFTYSRGALVGLVVVSLLMFIQLPFKQRFMMMPVIATAILMALMFAPESWRQRMNPTRKDAVDASANARLHAWSYARTLAADYPIAGGGFGTFTPELLGRYGFGTQNVHGPHSIYFQVLAEHGYVGLALYLSLAISCLLSARKLSKTARRRGDRTIMHYANMFHFSLIAFLVSGTFLGRAYFDFFFTIVACIVALKNIAAAEWEAEDAEEQMEDEYHPSDTGRLAWEGAR